jgi:lipopolysaccharide transport system permease protein
VKNSTYLLNPWLTIVSVHKNRRLLWELVRRDLRQQYQGSYLGVLWTIIFPLFMLLIYTFVFSMIFQSRWPESNGETPPSEFAIILFAGLTAFNVFSTVATRSPSVILNVPNYVKKVVFPLDLLPVMLLGTALINSAISVCLVMIGSLVLLHTVSATIYLFPLAYLPLIFLCLGAAWLLASLGVYIRDMGQLITILVQILFFITPIFYSASVAPAFLQWLFRFNPLVVIVDSFRRVLLWGQMIDWPLWGIWTLLTFLFAQIAYYWFMKTKKGFADVL